MNSCEPISITETPASLWKCGTTWSDMVFHLRIAMEADEINRTAAMLKCRAPYWRVQLIPRAPAAHWLMQIRHNLVVPEKPFFRRGRCVLKEAHHLGRTRKRQTWPDAEASDLARRGSVRFGKTRKRLILGM